MNTLADKYFLEVLGFDAAKRAGSIVGKLASKEGRGKISDMHSKVASGTIATHAAATKLADTLKNTTNTATQTAGKVGGMAGQAALGATYVGAAFLAYKGIQKLKDRFSKSNNPQEKENLKKQMDAGKMKLKRSKEIDQLKRRQASEKRQKDSQRKM